jgi:hypothetical protein
VALSLALSWLAPARPAAAQTFPSANRYVALPCGGGVMVDALDDTPNASGALDLVGTSSFPAGFHAADAQFLYLRLRVAANPVVGGRLQANGWGFEFDLDGDRRSYELLISASGLGNSDEVAIYRHPTAVVADDPADPAIAPPAFSYPFATHGQVSVADSTLSGAPDAFIDLALPWTDLAQVGVQRDTAVRIWAGSSTVANALDLDLACFGGAGGRLSGIDVGGTAPDPDAAGGGGGGGGAGGTGPRTLEGGPGCAFGGSAAGSPGAIALVLAGLALWLGRRARRRG